MADQILQELWSIKDSMSNECGRDMRELFDKLKNIEKTLKQPTINRTTLRKHAPVSS